MRGTVHLQRDQPVIAADAVILMHHQITFCDFSGLGDELISPLAPARRARDPLAQQVLLTHHGQTIGDEATFQPERHQSDGPARQRLGGLPAIGRFCDKPMFAQQVS